MEITKDQMAQLAQVAVSAMSGDYEKTRDEFVLLCDNMGVSCLDKEYNLSDVAECSINVCAGNNGVETLCVIAEDLGLSIEFPNEDKTMEEERAETYNESVQQ